MTIQTNYEHEITEVNHEAAAIREAAQLFVKALDNPVIRTALMAQIGLAVVRGIRPEASVNELQQLAHPAFYSRWGQEL